MIKFEKDKLLDYYEQHLKIYNEWYIIELIDKILLNKYFSIKFYI